MKILFIMFVLNNKNMASISIRAIPDEIHRKMKRIQLDLEDEGEKKSLEEIYIMIIEKGLQAYQAENPDK